MVKTTDGCLLGLDPSELVLLSSGSGHRLWPFLHRAGFHPRGEEPAHRGILSLSGLHRELWTEVHRRDLRGLSKSRPVAPISLAEEEFLNLVLVHFYTGWQLARLGTGVSMDVLQKDVQSFFARPIPRAIWQKTRGERDVRFVRFVEKCFVTQGSG